MLTSSVYVYDEWYASALYDERVGQKAVDTEKSKREFVAHVIQVIKASSEHRPSRQSVITASSKSSKRGPRVRLPKRRSVFHECRPSRPSVVQASSVKDGHRCVGSVERERPTRWWRVTCDTRKREISTKPILAHRQKLANFLCMP